MLTDVVFEDKTILAPLTQEMYEWIYDPSLKLLVLFPRVEANASREKNLWLKILAACQLHQWSDWFSNQLSSHFKSGRFVLNDDSIEFLFRRFKPKYMWVIGQYQIDLLPLNCKVFHTDQLQFWLKQPLIKKQIWLTWLSIQQGLV